MSFRSIPDLVDVLREWREAELPVNGWLFGNIDTGKPYHADTMRQRHLNKAAAKIGPPEVGAGTPSGIPTGHDCRNSAFRSKCSRS